MRIGFLLSSIGELTMMPVAMTIAGSDPSGGAGIQADLKTFHQHGVYGTSIVTLLTVQNTQSVSAIEILDSNFVLAQLDAVLGDIPAQAAKIGALGSVANIEALAERAKSFSFPLVLDPSKCLSRNSCPLRFSSHPIFPKRRDLPRWKSTTCARWKRQLRSSLGTA